MFSKANLDFIESILEYKFNNISLLEKAFTHSSYAFLHNEESNEKLEFLGDSVLNFCTTTYLFDNFNHTEGEFSKIRAFLVSSENVSVFIKQNKLENYLLCDNFNPHNSVNVMGDLYEAIVGAMFKDGGIEVCKNFVYKSLNYSKTLIENVLTKTKDYKTELQEFLQRNGKINLEYVLLEKTGPAHNPEFTVQVKIDDKLYAKATAKSKKEAENICAKETLNALKI